ncbi:MAG: hypothetical protein ABSB83_04300 [Methanomassiliicoccales archaeon]
MAIKVRLFGVLTKRASGFDRTGMVGIMEIEKGEVRNVSGILRLLDLKEVETSHLLLNNEYCVPASTVSEGDTVAIFPSNMAIKWLQ